MVTKEERQNLSEKVNGIMVIPIDVKKLNADIDKAIKDQLEKCKESTLVKQAEPDEYFAIRGSLALIKGTSMIVDTECVGQIIEDGKVKLDVYSEKRKEDGGLKGFGMFPSYTNSCKLSEMLEEYALPEISLEDYMKDRFAYNDRICRNIYEIVKEYKAQTA